MTNARLLKNNSGFSLVELMVVVAIIGILATVAIPSVNKYMGKARQSEAKTNLASIYSANKAFFVEYNTFGTHFPIIGFAPEGRLRYNVGFGAAMAAATYSATGWAGTIPAAATIQASGYCTGTLAALTASGRGACVQMAEAVSAGGLAAAATATNTTFIARAESSLMPGAGLIDTWEMDQGKVLTNVTPGL